MANNIYNQQFQTDREIYAQNGLKGMIADVRFRILFLLLNEKPRINLRQSRAFVVVKIGTTISAILHVDREASDLGVRSPRRNIDRGYVYVSDVTATLADARYQLPRSPRRVRWRCGRSLE